MQKWRVIRSLLLIVCTITGQIIPLLLMIYTLAWGGSALALDQPTAQQEHSRSRFQYQDADKLPDERYLKPSPSDDRQALEIQELRARLVQLEERVETLEKELVKR